MKKYLLLVLVTAVTATHCTTMRPTDAIEASARISIACNNDLQLRRQAVWMLKSARARDIQVNEQGWELSIEGIFVNTDTPLDKMDDLVHQLQNMPGVIEVHLEKNWRAIRDDSYKAQ